VYVDAHLANRGVGAGARPMHERNWYGSSSQKLNQCMSTVGTGVAVAEAKPARERVWSLRTMVQQTQVWVQFRSWINACARLVSSSVDQVPGVAIAKAGPAHGRVWSLRTVVR
jgi:hypothetical protein